MNFQGRLNNAAGSPMPAGSYNMKFRIYDAASGGTLLWSEQRANSASTGVTVTAGGLFSVQLGSVTSLPAAIFNNPNSIYFEIELPTPDSATCNWGGCEAYTEGAMTPRNPLGSSAYAFNSDTLDGHDASYFAPASGSANYAPMAGGLNYIQNGVTPQSAGFNISGDGTIGGNFTNTGSALFATDSTAAVRIQNASGKNLFVADTQSSQVTVTGTTVVNAPIASNVPTVVGGSASYANQTSSATIDTNASTQIGDLVVVVGYIEPANQQSASATYGNIIVSPSITLAPGFPINTDDAAMTTKVTHRLYVGYFYATANGSTPVTFSTDVTTGQIAVATATIRGGPTSGNPFADAPFTASVSSTATGITSSPPISLNLGGPNSLVLWTFGDWNGGNDLTYPTGYTDLTHAQNYPGQPAIGYKTYSAAGSTGNVTIPRTGNDQGMTAALLSIRNANNGATATSLFTADTTNIKVQIGSAVSDATSALLVLDSYNQSADPTGAGNGSMYYNTSTNKFRCYQNNAWIDCAGGSGGGGSSSLQAAYTGSGSVAPKIKVDAALGGLSIQDSDAPSNKSLFSIHQSKSSGLGTSLFSVSSDGSIEMGALEKNATIYSNVTQSGTLLFTPMLDSTETLQIRNAAQAILLTASTSNMTVEIGSTNSPNEAAFLVLDSYNSATDPPYSAYNGAMYYNTSMNAFRCYEGGAWKKCIGGTSSALSTLPSSGATVANTTSDTNFSPNYVIPANTCVVGKTYRVTARGVYGTAGTAPTLSFTLKINSSTLATTGAVTTNANMASRQWVLTADVICGNTGFFAYGNVFRSISANSATSSANYWEMPNSAPALTSLTVANTIYLSAKWGTANASNTITLQQFHVQPL